jgi:DNA-binding NarL/FixJ family response regulator
MLRIAWVGKIVLIREGIKNLIGKQKDMLLVAEVSEPLSGADVVDKSPTAVIVDESCSRELVHALVKSGIKVVAVTGAADRGARARDPAIAMVPYDAREEEILDALRDAARGRRHVSSRFLMTGEGSPVGSLSPRERDVFALLVKGLSNTQVAKALYISAKTVETHRANVYRKLGAHNVADLVHAAYRGGVLEARSTVQ